MRTPKMAMNAEATVILEVQTLHVYRARTTCNGNLLQSKSSLAHVFKQPSRAEYALASCYVGFTKQKVVL